MRRASRVVSHGTGFPRQSAQPVRTASHNVGGHLAAVSVRSMSSLNGVTIVSPRTPDIHIAEHDRPYECSDVERQIAAVRQREAEIVGNAANAP
jgi:hypothetical protein